MKILIRDWFSRWWWKYLFENGSYGSYRGENLIERMRHFWCRVRGHKCGPVWYSTGMDPNMHCKNCGDEL